MPEAVSASKLEEAKKIGPSQVQGIVNLREKVNMHTVRLSDFKIYFFEMLLF